ncbi:MAG: hypothetical protein ACOVOT_14080 [Rubrivivax sp.]|nr:hypothetical protein [Rubrivivax sp.]
MLTRRTCLATAVPAVAHALFPIGAAAQTLTSPKKNPRPGVRTLPTLFDGMSKGESPAEAFRRNFLPAIDYSFSRYNAKRLIRVVDGFVVA